VYKPSPVVFKVKSINYINKPLHFGYEKDKNGINENKIMQYYISTARTIRITELLLDI
jgi:hypothetical protein